MGNKNSAPTDSAVESAINIVSTIVPNGDKANPREHPASHSPSPSRSSPALDTKWSTLFSAIPIEILTSIFRYLHLNFQSVIGLRLVSKKWSKYIFSRIPMDLDAAFITFKRLSFLPLITGLKVAGCPDALKEIKKISTIQKLYLGHDSPNERPKEYALLNSMKNLRELALVNLRSLPAELDLGKLVNLTGLEVSGHQSNLKINGLENLVNLKKLILMRQPDPTLVPITHFARLTNLQYLHIFAINQPSDLGLEHMGLTGMKNLKTLKIVAGPKLMVLPRNFSNNIKHIENLALASLRIESMADLASLGNLKQLELTNILGLYKNDIFGLTNLEILKMVFEDRQSEIARLRFKPDLTLKCQKMRELTLGHCCFSEETCTAITKFPNLEYLSVPYCKDLKPKHIYLFAEMDGLKVLDLSYSSKWIGIQTEENSLPFYQEIEAKAKTLRTVYLIGYTDYRKDVYNVDFVHSRI